MIVACHAAQVWRSMSLRVSACRPETVKSVASAVRSPETAPQRAPMRRGDFFRWRFVVTQWRDAKNKLLDILRRLFSAHDDVEDRDMIIAQQQTLIDDLLAALEEAEQIIYEIQKSGKVVQEGN